MDNQFVFLELSPKNAADAFWNGELENEVRILSQESALTLDEAVFYTDSDREKIMDKVESLRSCSIYPHINCSSECKERGMLKALYITWIHHVHVYFEYMYIIIIIIIMVT